MKQLLTLILISLSSILYSQSGLMYYKCSQDGNNIIQGQFRFTVENDSLSILEDYTYIEDNKHKRYTLYWKEKIIYKVNYYYVYYTDSARFIFSMNEQNEFITCLYEPSIGDSWYYKR